MHQVSCMLVTTSGLTRALRRPAGRWRHPTPAEGGDKLHRHTVYIMHVYSHVVVVIVVLVLSLV